MYKEKERKYKNVKTTEILDFVAKDIDYSKDKECDKQNDYSEELEQRKPFQHIKSEIDRLREDGNHLRDAIQNLLKHKHIANGEPSLDLKETVAHYLR